MRPRLTAHISPLLLKGGNKRGVCRLLCCQVFTPDSDTTKAMEPIKVGFRCLRPQDSELLPPKTMSDNASGVDLRAAVDQDIIIQPGKTVAIPIGMQLEIPVGYEGQVRPRSGLALQHSVGILNSPGTIDADYRGEVQVILTNFGKEDFVVHRGDRVAQLVFQRVIGAEFVLRDNLTDTNRGTGGLGHTGKQ